MCRGGYEKKVSTPPQLPTCYIGTTTSKIERTNEASVFATLPLSLSLSMPEGYVDFSFLRRGPLSLSAAELLPDGP